MNGTNTMQPAGRPGRLGSRPTLVLVPIGASLGPARDQIRAVVLPEL